MKKSLIALATLAATGAFAQSSVTLYGVADLAIAKTTGKSAGLTSDAKSNDGASRVGFRGTEDLGGGLKANFTFEQFIDLETGASKSDDSLSSVYTNAVAGYPGDASRTNLWHRAAWVGLSGGFGELRVGRQLTPAFFGLATWDLTGMANYSTNAGKFGFANDSGPRYNSHIAYTTPDMSGFKVSLGSTLKGDNANASQVAANATYANGPLAVGFSYSKTSTAAEASSAIGAKYDFGGFTVAAGYLDPAGVTKGFNIGASTNLGPVNVALEAARETNYKTTDVALSARYPLSKRTFIYAVAYRADMPATIAKAADPVKGTSAVAAKAAYRETTTSIGIRHNF